MTRILMLCAAATAALSLAACNRETGETANPGQSQPVNAAQDAASAAVGAVSASTLGANTLEGYATNAAISDMYEIAAGQIAQQKGGSADVKAFGKMMVADHTATSTEMKQLAQAANVTLPTEMDERRKGMIDNLNAASGADFDRTYLAQQTAAHQEAVTLHQGYAENGDNAQLKAFAAKTAPKVQAHLEHARKLEQAAGGQQQQQ